MEDHERRSEPRSNMFVLATLSSETTSGAVKIRNLSAGGALIEGMSLPTPGTPIKLVRGDNIVHGHVVWNANGKAGLQFSCRTTADAWTPGGHARQAQIDRTFQQIKSGMAPSAPDEVRDGLSAEELSDLAQAVENLANALSDDLHVIQTHGTKLQSLDLATQILRKLAQKAAAKG